MRKDSLVFLKKLLSTPTPSGFEAKGQRVWLDYATQFADETFTDTYGNAVAVMNPKGDPKVIIAGHGDEIGLMINHIDDKGFIFVKSIGGIDPAVVPGKRLYIHTKKESILGITGATAIHLRDRDGEEKPRKLHELFIDIGSSSREDVEKRGVRVGDPITFADDFEMLGEHLAVARAFDNRIGSWVAAESLRLMKESSKKLSCAVYAASCVQEEVGCKGSRMLTVQLKPDIGLVCDVGHATDTPGISAEKHGLAKLGKGPLMDIGTATLPELNARFESIAEKKKISFQRVAMPNWSGTDADSIYVSAGGAACAVISLPLRYMHTTVEMADLRDLELIPQLFAEFCLSLKKGERFKMTI